MLVRYIPSFLYVFMGVLLGVPTGFFWLLLASNINCSEIFLDSICVFTFFFWLGDIFVFMYNSSGAEKYNLKGYLILFVVSYFVSFFFVVW